MRGLRFEAKGSGLNVAHRATLFPFWVVVCPDNRPSLILATPRLRYAAAFVSSESARAYLYRHRDASRCELHLVCRATFGELAERLRSIGVSGLRFEPDPLGHGETITLAQMDRFLTPPSVAPRSTRRPKEHAAAMRITQRAGPPQKSRPDIRLVRRPDKKRGQTR